MAYTSKDPRRRAAYRERQKLYKRRRYAQLKALNLLKGTPSVALRWSQYDPGYQAALLFYKEHGTFSSPPCSLKQAQGARIKFHLYKKAVHKAIESGVDYDPILLDLVDILRHVTVTIEPTGDADEGFYIVRLYRDIWAASLDESLE